MSLVYFCLFTLSMQSCNLFVYSASLAFVEGNTSDQNNIFNCLNFLFLPLFFFSFFFYFILELVSIFFRVYMSCVRLGLITGDVFFLLAQEN